MQTVKEESAPQEAPSLIPEKEYTPPVRKPVYEVCKRIFDLIVCSVGLIVLSPVFLAVAIAIKREDGGKVIYKQTRLTKGGRQFSMYKFRSMIPDADKMIDSLMDQNEVNGPAFKITHDPRITKVGRFIRRASLDELPQLVNIIKGDMSIVGPRPPLPREVAQYTPYQKHRLDVICGLACYHEVEGRSESKDFDRWVEQDLRYIRERGFATDLRIMFLTAKVVFTGKGAV